MNPSPARVLMVCTGNICRSPSMHYWAQQQWGDAAVIRSAGTYAEVGMDATGPMRRAALAHGLTMPRHEPRQLDAAAIEWADLVLVATATHAQWIEHHAGTDTEHVFGLHEAVDLAATATPPAGKSSAERLTRMAQSLASARREQPVPFRDLQDPWGLDHETHERVMGEIASALDTLSAWAEITPGR